MASSKKPTYKVETKLATERKRRRSDLVVMWHSIWGVTAIIIKELWMTMHRMWEFIELWFSSSERFLVQTWLEKYLPYVPEDFSESWRDGRLLAILLNKLQPGCFPDANRLDPDYGLKNVYRVFDALETYFGVKPNVSVEEIVTCSDGADAKLFAILQQLKNSMDSQPENEFFVEPEPTENTESSGAVQSCVAKGTGLVVAFVGRSTHFIIFCASMADIDVVVEIRGPNTICSERITKRSPRKKNSLPSWECAKYLSRSTSLNEKVSTSVSGENENYEKMIIPLEYEIISNQIRIGYKPKEKGKHKITILWHGQHVSDSPYFVTVEDPLEIVGANQKLQLKSALKTDHVGENPELRKISVRFQESPVRNKDRPSGKVLSRRVLRYIVKVHGKDIPVNADSKESLATELLKMDYDFETCPSFHRRNSWGFAGEEERKKSVIRQFGVDVKELEAQISQRRSNSLSINTVSKRSLEKSDSFDCLSSKLSILKEDAYERNDGMHEREDDYAYVSETFSLMHEKEKISDKDCETEPCANSVTKNDDFSLSSELTESKCDRRLRESLNFELQSDKISSLSTDTITVVKDDSSKEDSSSNICPWFSTDECNETYAGENCQSCEKERKLFESENAKGLNKTSDTKKFKRDLNIKSYRRKHQGRSELLKELLKRKEVHKNSAKLFYKKVHRNRNSNFSFSFAAFRKLRVTKRTLKTEKSVSSIFLKNSQIKSNKASKNSRSGHDNEGVVETKEEDMILPSEASSEIIVGEQNATFVEKQFNKICGLQETVKADPARILKFPTETDDIRKLSRNSILENNIEKEHDSNTKTKIFPSTPVAVKTVDNGLPNMQQTYHLGTVVQSNVKCSSNEFPSCLKQPETETKDMDVKKSKTLRIHTLRSLGEFNFAQFNPALDSQNNISPIQLQIGQWERTLTPEEQKAPVLKSYTSDIEQGSVKQKLAFWENTYKADQKPPSKRELENNRKMNSVLNKKTPEGISSNIPLSRSKKFVEPPVNEEMRKAPEKLSENKEPGAFKENLHEFHTLSFSDPVVSDSSAEIVDNSLNFSSAESSQKEYCSSSADDNLADYDDSDDSEDSGGDYVLHSTEDEYIDDEISERASEYWGDLSIMKGWKASDVANDYSFLGEEFLKKYHQRDKSHPEECKVFGIAIYYGHVAIKNRFQVYSGDAGFGNLSVSMQGFRQHEVSLVSVAYIRNEIYEVTYQVMTPGYYLISIRWLDREIPGSPFVCKVTF